MSDEDENEKQKQSSQMSLGDTFGSAFKTATSPIAKAAKKIDKGVSRTVEKISGGASSHGASTNGSRSASNDEDADEWADAVAHDAVDPKAAAADKGAPSPVPPDSTLTKMDVFIEEEVIKGVSVQDFYDVIWSENDNVKPFYAPWLTGCGKMNVAVGGWEKCGAGKERFIGEWDNETYDQMRVVTFTTKRSGIGPPTADVTQTQLCRVEGADKCVVAFTINMKVPFGDCFSVQVRWVASRLGAMDLSISTGMLITFNKSCLVEGKIRANTTKETKKGQSNLFETLKEACKSVAGIDVAANEPSGEEEKEKEEGIEKEEIQAEIETDKPCWGALPDFFIKIFGKKDAIESLPRHDGQHDDIVRSICDAHYQLGKIHNTIRTQKSIASKKERVTKSELSKINDALAKVVKQLEE